MKGHRGAVLQAVSQTEAHRELEENRMLVLKLRKEKEQLKEDLENPNGNTLQMAKVEKAFIHFKFFRNLDLKW